MNEQNFLAVSEISPEESTKLYMMFSLSGKKYAIPANQIIEVIQLPELKLLEKVPEYIVGLLNLRGSIISVIDIRNFLGLPNVGYSVENQVLLVNINNKTIGIVVDSVDEVIQFNRENLEPLPYEKDKTYIHGICKQNEDLIAFLDFENLMSKIQTVENESIDTINQLPVEFFPQDEDSKYKLKKRALNLQKEIKVDINKYNIEENRFVSFSLNNEAFCISLKYVKEFCKLKFFSLTPVPCVPEFIEGIINLRGDFITLINVKSFLGMEKSPTCKKNKIIVIKSEKLKIGFLVDDVYEIINIPVEKIIYNSPKKLDNQHYTSADVILDEQNIMSILDIETIIEDERLFIEDAV